MADLFSGPSFSLGLDLSDLPTDDEQQPSPKSQEDGGGVETNEEAIETLAVDPEEGLGGLEQEERPFLGSPPRPVLRRLRRGHHGSTVRPPPAPSCGSRGCESGVADPNDDFEEIEEFSSQEDQRRRDDCSSVQSRAGCSGSKLSLRCNRILTSQSSTKIKPHKIPPVSNASASADFEASSSKKLLPKLTISPIRRILLLDSDSDDPSSKDKCTNGEEIDAFMVRNEEEKRIFQSNELQKESIWKDFSSKQDIRIATPALDEFCEEYFSSAKDPNLGQNKVGGLPTSSSRSIAPDDFMGDFEDYYTNNCSTRSTKNNREVSDFQYPVDQYFYHNDERIQRLVRERLPYFVPLGGADHEGGHQFGQENVDYMTQFGPKDGPSRVRGTREIASEGSSKGKKRKLNNAPKESSHASGSWVDPRSSASDPKDAGKRRVRANGHQSGHWFTGRDGKRVYVTSNGQELTGRVAYSHYRKESGTGFRKSRKKTAVNRRQKKGT